MAKPVGAFGQLKLSISILFQNAFIHEHLPRIPWGDSTTWHWPLALCLFPLALPPQLSPPSLPLSPHTKAHRYTTSKVSALSMIELAPALPHVSKESRLATRTYHRDYSVTNYYRELVDKLLQGTSGKLSRLVCHMFIIVSMSHNGQLVWKGNLCICDL